MNGERKQARRYHWLSEGLASFVEAPHAAIEGPDQGEIVNLTDKRAAASRLAQLDLLSALGPDGITRELASLETRKAKPVAAQAMLPYLAMPAHHDVRASDVVLCLSLIHILMAVPDEVAIIRDVDRHTDIDARRPARLIRRAGVSAIEHIEPLDRGRRGRRRDGDQRDDTGECESDAFHLGALPTR